MEKITNFFLSPTISDFFKDFDESEHRVVAKVLIKTSIEILRSSGLNWISLVGLKVSVKKILNSQFDMDKIKKHVVILENRLNELEKSLKSKVLPLQRSLESYIYPSWWLDMGKFQSSQKSHSKSQSLSQPRPPPLQFPSKPQIKVPKLNLHSTPPTHEKSYQNSNKSYLSSYSLTREVKEFYQNQFKDFLDSQSDFFQSL